MEVKVIAQMDNTIDNTFESANRVYGIDGIAPTLPTGCGGGIRRRYWSEYGSQKNKCLRNTNGQDGVRENVAKRL